MTKTLPTRPADHRHPIGAVHKGLLRLSYQNKRSSVSDEQGPTLVGFGLSQLREEVNSTGCHRHAGYFAASILTSPRLPSSDGQPPVLEGQVLIGHTTGPGYPQLCAV